MARGRKLIAGNWKMNGLKSDGLALAREVRTRAEREGLSAEILVCPPATLISLVGDALAGGPVALGGQDCHAEAKGAHTGDVSAPMLADLGCRYVIVGHSERRQNHGENDELIRRKAEAALTAGLSPIICVGETRAERDAGQAFTVVEKQIAQSVPKDAAADRIVIAYEPVWAIGTGLVATSDDIAAMHAHIRQKLKAQLSGGETIRILYGGSVKPSNAADVFAVADVDGALVGGASLVADDFWAIASSCR